MKAIGGNAEAALYAFLAHKKWSKIENPKETNLIKKFVRKSFFFLQ